jgi:hypothetical protein
MTTKSLNSEQTTDLLAFLGKLGVLENLVVTICSDIETTNIHYLGQLEVADTQMGPVTTSIKVHKRQS